MFWAFLVFVGLAIVFSQLGAMSVWIFVLKAGLSGALLALALVALALLWRKGLRR